MPTRSSSLLISAAALIFACNQDAAGGTDTDGEGSTGGTVTAGPDTNPSSSSPTSGTEATTDAEATSDADTSASTSDSESESGSDSSSSGDPQPSVCEEHGSYDVAFSTYFGGAEDWEHTRGIVSGPDGSIYIVGGTASDDFPTTAGAYDETFNGNVDVFISKFTPEGELEWSTLFGGANYDRAYTIRVDASGDVYIGGRGGQGLPTTDGSLQPNFAGFNTGNAYGQQNGFMAKFSGDGGTLLWSTYVGVGALIRTFDLDDAGDIYASLSIEPQSPANQPGWMDTAFDGAYQPTPGSARDNGVVKIDSDGSAVAWASWLGGNGDERPRSTVRVDAEGRPHVLVPTTSDNLETTPGAWMSSYQGNEDLYLARLSADGSTLELGTYIGGTELDEIETHGLGLADDAIYVGFYTQSPGIETTPGAFQTAYGGGSLDTMVVRLEPDGALSASTYVGGDGADVSDGFDVTPSGEVVLVGESSSTNFPTTPDAFQTVHAGELDGTVVRLSADLSTLTYGSFFGGPGRDNLRTSAIDGDCTVIIAGASDGPGFPTQNAMQPNFAGGSSDFGNGDNVLVRLTSAQ